MVLNSAADDVNIGRVCIVILLYRWDFFMELNCTYISSSFMEEDDNLRSLICGHDE